MAMDEGTALRWFNLGYDPPKGYSKGDFFEAVIERTYGVWLRPGDHAIDGGANRGRHSFPMAETVRREGRILAIEALPELAQNLAKLAKERGLTQLEVVNCAVGEEAGTAEFIWVKSLPAFSGLRQRPDIPEAHRSSIVQINVPVLRMDDLLAANGIAPRFIKLDLEGGEYHTLLGATVTLARYRPFVIFENGRQGSANLYKYSSREWFDLFDKVGYATYTLFGAGFSSQQWTASSIPWYYIAVPRGGEAEAFVKHRIEGLAAEVESGWIAR